MGQRFADGIGVPTAKDKTISVYHEIEVVRSGHIRAFSSVAGEDEVLMLPGSKFQFKYGEQRQRSGEGNPESTVEYRAFWDQVDGGPFDKQR